MRILGWASFMLFGALLSAPIEAKQCATARDMSALNTRVLQTELMVAALSCEEQPRYNEFSRTFRAVLTDRANDLRSYFQKGYGGRGTTELNAFVTRMANDASRQSQLTADTYCSFASDLFDEILSVPPIEINKVADKPWVHARHGVRSCSVGAAKR
jgi:hypothetical protein